MQRTIVIVGAGFSGTLTAVHLLSLDPAGGLRIVLLERTAGFGRGLAYGTWDDNLLLNVPAGNMSALADDSGHFVSYIRKIDPNFNSGSFLPRRIYGEYLADTLEHAMRSSSAHLEKFAGEAVAVRRTPSAQGFVVALADGQRILADQVLLALGHFPPSRPAWVSEPSMGSHYVANPWDWAALDRIDAGRAAVLLGTGHTAIDTLFRLTSRGGPRKCFLISRRGLLPHGHRLTPRQPATVAFPSYLPAPTRATVRGNLRAIRAEIRRRSGAGEDWRDVVNDLRPHTPEMWRQLPLSEQRRFLDRVAPFWDIHRHRLAPAANLRLHRMIDSGHVQVVAGRIVRGERRGADVCLIVRQRSDGQEREFTAGAVINCTGPDYDIAQLDGPLVRQLRDDGLLVRDALGLGLQIDARYQLIDRAGDSVENLFYLGPMLKARQWEAIAVPELRVHSQRVAEMMRAAAAGTPWAQQAGS